jgi:prepilin-type N-terminal cleavage/methylation domain-containing protein
MMNTAYSNQGFSLLEVVIALAIFSIGIVGLYSVQTRTIGQNYTASRITTAANWGADKVEDLLALSYQDLKDINNDGTAGLSDSTTATADGSETSPDGVYTLLWNVAVNRPIYRTKTVRVIVTSPRAGTGNLVDIEYVKHEEI